MNIVVPDEVNLKPEASEVNSTISQVLTNNIKTLKKTKLTLASLRFIKREKKV